MAKRRLAIALVLILAAALRLHGIGRLSLWFDEAATVHIVRQPFGRMIELIKTDERTPPLHYVILWNWTRVFGNSEASVRLPSAIAGIAAVGLLYLLVSRLVNPQAGILAALLLALSRYQIAYSQEARAYALMLMLAIWSCYLFVRLMERRTPRREAAYVIVTALLLWSHLYGVFVIFAQHVAFWFWSPLPLWERVRVRGETLGDRESSPSPLPSPTRGEGVGRWLLLNVAVLALFSPWIPTAITWTRYVSSSFWTPAPTPAQIVRTYLLYAGSKELLLLLVFVAMLGVWKRWDRRATPLFLSLALLPVLIPAIVSALTRPTFTDRYAIFAPAGLYALAAIPLGQVKIQVNRAIVVICLGFLSLIGQSRPFEKPDWRRAGRYLSSVMRPNDIPVINRRNNSYLYDYYVHRPDLHLRRFDGSALPLEPAPGQRIWLIASSSNYPPDEIIARGRWKVMSHRSFGKSIEVFELTPALSPTTSATLPTTRSP